MPQPIALVGVSTVSGGPGYEFPGVITGLEGFDQYGDSDIVAVVGANIEPHGPGLHAAATMVQGSPDTFVNGLALCRVGDLASCGCTVDNGSPDTFCE
jgi:uncharacterized Zn-binding protein involved in type VI secretion